MLFGGVPVLLLGIDDVIELLLVFRAVDYHFLTKTFMIHL